MQPRLLFLIITQTFISLVCAQTNDYLIDINDEWLVFQDNKYLPYYDGFKSKAKHIFVSANSNSPRYLFIETSNLGTSVFIDNILMNRMYFDTLYICRIDTFTKKTILVSVYNQLGVKDIKAQISSSPIRPTFEKITKQGKQFLEIKWVSQPQTAINIFVLYFVLLIVNLFLSPLNSISKVWIYVNSLNAKVNFKNYDFFYLIFFVFIFSTNTLIINTVVEQKYQSFFQPSSFYSLISLAAYMLLYFFNINVLSSMLRKRQLSTIHILESIKTFHIFIFIDSILIFFFTLRPELIRGFEMYVPVLQYVVFFFLKLILIYRLNSSIDNTKSLKIIYLCITELVPSALYLSFFVKT